VDLEAFALAIRIREIGLRQGLKQAEVACRMGLDPSITSGADGWCPEAACQRWLLRSESALTNSEGLPE
jgi:hypothetical protein